MNELIKNDVMEDLVSRGLIKEYKYYIIKDSYLSDKGFLTITFNDGTQITVSSALTVPHGCLDWSYENVKIDAGCEPNDYNPIYMELQKE